MPIYEFKNEQGVTEEHWYSMAEAPPIGSQVVIEDRLLTRIPTLPRVSVEGSSHFVAWSQPLCNPDGSVPPGQARAERYDLDPKSPSYRSPLFAGKREVEKYVADSQGTVTYER